MKNLFELKKYFVRYKKKLWYGVFFIILSNIGSVYVPLILKDAINDLISGVTMQLLLSYAGLIIVTSFFAGIFRFFIRQTVIVVSREIEYDLRGDFWKHIQQLPLRYFQNNSTGNIMAHATNDINAVRMFLGPAVMYSMDTFVRLVFVIAIMISIDWRLTIYSLLPLPFLSLIIYKLGKIIHKKFTLIQEKFSELTAKAQENFSGIRVVKSYVREDYELNDFKKLGKEYLDKNMSMVKTQAFFQPLLFLITGISIIIVIWVGGGMVIDGKLNIGDITAFSIYLGILIWPMIAVGWVINIIQQAEASMKRLNKILNEPYEIQDEINTDISINKIKGKIEFNNVSFRYSENLPYVLKDINLTINEGMTLAVMGLTGSGKSTFFNLIPRLYDVSEGEILIDGNNIKIIPLETLRKNIGYAPQETFLFSDSIYNNLTYGNSDVNKEWIEYVSEVARFNKDVEDFPLKYETVIGERGITLSGGQKQRAALARALAINPNILLIDDSFSAVDTNTEEEILKNLKKFMEGRTSIIISHRVSTVKDADKIIVLSNGTITEQGTHDELLTLNGIYADIYYKQLLEKELEELN